MLKWVSNSQTDSEVQAWSRAWMKVKIVCIKEKQQPRQRKWLKEGRDVRVLTLYWLRQQNKTIKCTWYSGR